MSELRITFEEMRINRRPHVMRGDSMYHGTEPFSQITDKNGNPMNRSDVINALQSSSNIALLNFYDKIKKYSEGLDPSDFGGLIFDAVLRSCADGPRKFGDLQSEFLYVIEKLSIDDGELRKFANEIFHKRRGIVRGEIETGLAGLTEEEIIEKYGSFENAERIMLDNDIRQNKAIRDSKRQQQKEKSAQIAAANAQQVLLEANQREERERNDEQRKIDAENAQREIGEQQKMSALYQEQFREYKDNHDKLAPLESFTDAKTILPELRTKFEYASRYPSYFGFGRLEQIKDLLAQVEQLIILSLKNVELTSLDEENGILKAFVEIECAIKSAYDFLKYTVNADKTPVYLGRLYRPISPDLRDVELYLKKTLPKLEERIKQVELDQKNIENAVGIEYFSRKKRRLESELGRDLNLGELNQLARETIIKTTSESLGKNKEIGAILSSLSPNEITDSKRNDGRDIHGNLIADVFRESKNILTQKDKINIAAFMTQLKKMQTGGRLRLSLKHKSNRARNKRTHKKKHNKKTHKRRANKKRRKTMKKRR